MTSDEHRQARAVSFGAVADAYERGRPPYPPEAIDWLLPAGAARVLDLGAGTGKLTRQLAGRGLDVTAVEPSEGMREQLRRVVPGVSTLAGSAERIPLPGRSVDSVLVCSGIGVWTWRWISARARSGVTTRRWWNDCCAGVQGQRSGLVASQRHGASDITS